MRTRDRSRRRRRYLQSLSLHLLRLYITEWGHEVVPAKTRLPPTLVTSPYATDYSVNIELGFFVIFFKSNMCSLNSVIFVMAVYMHNTFKMYFCTKVSACITLFRYMHICKHSVLDKFTLVNSVTYTFWFFFFQMLCVMNVCWCLCHLIFYINLYSDTVITDTCLYNDLEVLLAAFYTFIYWYMY